MTRPSHVVLMCVATILAACGDSPTSPPPHVAFQVSGDSQLWFPNATLPVNLTIQLVDSEGAYSQTGDVAVTWTILEGGGSIGREADKTGPNGQARTSWTLGSNEGANRVQVQVGSLSPFVFTATAVFPGPIAFVSNRRTGDMGHDIREMAGDVFVMDEEGSHVIQLTPQDRGIAWLEDPAWAPDGQQVAYAQHPGGARAGPVYLIDSDGTEAIQVGPSGEYLDPSWSPDGERLIVESFTASGLWIIGARNAAEASRLPWQSQWWEPDSWAPDWSPDGTTIVFECGDATRRDVCKIGVDSTGFEHLTSGPADREPKWSPDGSRILFARDSANGGGIWVMNADGSAQVQVITGKASGPNWSPDGTEFVVAITNDLQQDIWRVTVATGDAVNLTKGVGFNRDPDWRW